MPLENPNNILLEVSQDVFSLIVLYRIDGEKPWQTLDRLLKQYVPNTRQICEADVT